MELAVVDRATIHDVEELEVLHEARLLRHTIVRLLQQFSLQLLLEAVHKAGLQAHLTFCGTRQNPTYSYLSLNLNT